MRFTAQWAAKSCDGTFVGVDRECVGVSFDSRTLVPDQLFAAIVGERDGHEFLGDAKKSGSRVFLVNDDWLRVAKPDPTEATYIGVENTVVALGQIARAARESFQGAVVGVTGSVGKTTTKELIRLALSGQTKVHASTASLNNDQGLPVSILNAPDDAEVWVLEMGMRGFGEISRLCRIAMPTIGVVTAVASAHSERVGGILGVAKAKAELIDALDENGTAVLNADDALVADMANRCAGRVISFGSADTADVRLEEMSVNSIGCVGAIVRTPWGAGELRMRVPGSHLATDAAAAIAVAGVLGLNVADACLNVSSYVAVTGRMQVHNLADGVTLIDDTYNANPSSMAAALQTLASVSASRRIAVLGAMAEISDSQREHDEVVRLADELGIEVVALDGASYPCPLVDVDGAVQTIRSMGAGVAVLVKGSRAAKAERVVQALLIV